MPLTVQGKPDVRALPDPWARAADKGAARQEPEAVPHSAASDPAVPADAVSVLALVWRHVLGVPRVRPEDDFFALGGDSLHAIRVVGAARENGLHVTVSQLYEHPRLVDLAHTLADAGNHQPPLPTAAPADTPAETPVVRPASSGQAGILYDCEIDPDPGLYRVLACVILTGRPDHAALKAALSETTARHDALRSHFEHSTSGTLQHISPNGTIPLFVHAPVAAPAEGLACETRWRRSWARRIGPYRPPLSHCHVLPHSDARTWELALIVHHAILDGWSLALLLDELLHRYTAHVQGRPIPAAPYPPNTPWHAAPERPTASGPDDRSFWAGQLARIQTGPLPAAPGHDHVGPGSVASSFTLDPARVRTLRDLAHRLAVPMKSLFVAAHMRVMATLSNQHQATAGLAFHHRIENDEGARAIGMFLGVLPVTVTVSPDVNWADLITDVFAQERTLMRYRWTPLTELLQQRGAPLFHAVINYTDFRPLRPLRDGPVRQRSDWLLRNSTAFPLYTEVQRHATDGRCTVRTAAHTPATEAHADDITSRLRGAVDDLLVL
nr:condensation domain-containing protein [Streptomyces sp. SID8352]